MSAPRKEAAPAADRLVSRVAAAALALSAACAEQMPRPVQALRTGNEPDAADARHPGPGADARSPGDREEADAAPDAAAPPTGSPEVTTFVRIRAEAWAEGVRAHLVPPQPGAGELDAQLDGLPGAVPVFDFEGPAAESTVRLLAALAGGRTCSAWYDPSARPESVETDVLFLGSRLFDDRHVARWAGEPVVFVGAGPATADALAALAALPHPPVVVRAASVAEPAPALGPGVVALVPLEAYGHAPDGSGGPPGVADEAALADLRRVALVEGDWVASARAARNPRLTAPALREAAVEPPGGDAALLRSLAMAREATVPGRRAVFVDGLGAWLDDRQLDDVVAVPPTHDPLALTAGVDYPGYGDRRRRLVVEALLAERAAPTPAEPLAPEPSLVILRRTESLEVSLLEIAGRRVRVRLADPTGEGRLQVLLDHRPFALPAGRTLVYSRTSPAVQVELLLAPAARARWGDAPVGDRLPPDAGIGTLRVPVGDLAGVQVEGVILEYRGGAGAIGDRAIDAEVVPPTLELSASP